MIKPIHSGFVAVILALSAMAARGEVVAFGRGDANQAGSVAADHSAGVASECIGCMFGVAGGNEMSNGLKAIYGADWEYHGPKSESRDRWLGISGDFGELKVGNLSTAWKSEGVIPDAGYRPSSLNASGLSPDYAGYTADTDGADKEDEVGLSYENAGLLVFADYISGHGSSNDPAYNVGAKLATDNFAVFGQYRIDTGTSGNELTDAPVGNPNLWFLGGSLTVGPTSIYAGYGRGDHSVNPGVIPGYDTWEVVGVHSLGKLTSIYAGYSGTGCSDKNADACNKPGGEAVDEDKFSLGIRHNF